MTANNKQAESALSLQERKDIKILALFTATYCRARHAGDRGPLVFDAPEWQGLALEPLRLCDECREFLDYAFSRRSKCPLDPKPTCKHCHIHCYRPGHRERIREIMRFSGRHLILRGRLDLLWHYLF